MTNFVLTIIIFVGFQMLLALGMNVMWGFTGMLNLAYIVYYAFGAYLTATLMLPKAQPPYTSYILGLHMPFLLAATIGLVASGLLAAVVGYVFLGRRRRGISGPSVRLAGPTTVQRVWRIDRSSPAVRSKSLGDDLRRHVRLCRLRGRGDRSGVLFNIATIRLRSANAGNSRG